MSGMKVGAVIITMGNRPDELRALLDSVAKQDGDPVEVVVVGNGSPVPDVPEGVRTIELPENLGIPGGRNVGIEASLLILVLAIVDQARGDLFFSRLGVAVLAGIALLQTLLHLVSILASSRLK